MNIRVAQIGARKGYAVVTALARHAMLESLCTDFYNTHGSNRLLQWVLSRFGGTRDSRALGNRQAMQGSEFQVHTHSYFGLTNRLAVRRAIRAGNPFQAYLRGGARFAKSASKIPWDNVDCVYGFSSACLELFQEAKKRGVRCVLDHETAPAVKEMDLIRAAEQAHANWLPNPGVSDSPGLREYASRQKEEAGLADAVLCPSRFSLNLTRDTGVPEGKLHCLPFAVSESFAAAEPKAPHPGPLRVLFAGHDAIRKGLPVLVAALKQLDKRRYEARGLGDWSLSDFGWTQCQEVMTTPGAIPRDEIREHYQWADVFVLPTFSDTMGAVILEAMSAGVPVIASVNSGGPDLIRDGVDGYLVPAGSAEHIAEKIAGLANDRDRLANLSQEARQAAQTHGFDSYADALVATLKALDSPGAI